MLQKAWNVMGQHILKKQRQDLTADSGAPGFQPREAWADPAADESTTHYSLSRYLPVWESICERIPLGSRVLEVGCGSAQLAQLLRDRRIPRSYVGFDFSPTAVALARRNMPGVRFELSDARITDLFTSAKYDVVICTEVLGHVVDDLQILRRIPEEKQVLATVSDFDLFSANRFFEDAGEVRSRYRCLFSSLEISEHHDGGEPTGLGGSGSRTHFLLDGVR